MKLYIVVIVTVMALAAVSVVRAQGTGGNRAPAAGGSAPGRTKSIDFEGDVVEGMGKMPLDSLEKLTKREDRDNSHLYKRKSSFRKEMRQQARDAGRVP